MRTFRTLARSVALGVTLAALTAGASCVPAAAGTAADSAGSEVPTSAPAAAANQLRAPTLLYPLGDGVYGRYLTSYDQQFSAVASDPGSASSQTEYVLQARASDAPWRTVDRAVAGSQWQPALPQGEIRWRARTLAEDVASPWSRWVELTVDDRQPAAARVRVAPGGAPVIAGRPATIALASPDGLAASYRLAGYDSYLSAACGSATGFVCATPPTTFAPWTFLDDDDDPEELYVRAVSRSGVLSDPVTLTVPVAPDSRALDTGRRWPVNEPAGTQTVGVDELHGGAPLALSAPVSVVDRPFVSDNGTAAVPSLGLTGDQTASTAPVDTSRPFSVGGYFGQPANDHVTLFDQRGQGGSAFVLELTGGHNLRFCVTTTDAVTTCVTGRAFLPTTDGHKAAEPGPLSAAIAVAYDPVRRQLQLAVDRDSVRANVWGQGAIRPAVGGLRVGYPRAVGSSAYSGAIGAPFVASGWVTATDLRALLTPPA